ncbi:MAG: S8/S53 family peptidase, partial [Acidobacteriales bacterium]|nr:S8/S53 family peptidase [Terriglobales bacterium]
MVTLRVSLLSAAVILCAAVSVAQSGQSDRIRTTIDDAQRVRVRGSVHPLATADRDQGRAAGNKTLRRASMVLRLSPAQQADLETLLREQQEPSSPNYHKWLTPEQYAQRFGVSEGDLGKITSWLQSQGLGVRGTSRGRTEIFFSGSVAQVEKVFQTEFHNYALHGQSHFANATELSVPVSFAPLVLGFRNLSDFRPQPRVKKASPEFTSSISGNHFLAPDDFATIYDLQPLYSAGIDGTGQTIAIVGQHQIDATDITTFRSVSGLPAYSGQQFQQVIVPGSGSPVMATGGDLTEADLDIEWSGAVARNANIVFVYVGNDSNYNVWDSLQYIIDQQVAPIISTSYGYCESGLGASFVQTVQQWAQQAAAQGQTITAAAGDAGVADCDGGGQSIATGGLAVDVPASVPEVTAIGGTEFFSDVKDSVPPVGTQYWTAANNTKNGSAKSYIPEEVWNDTSQGQGIAASGGGFSVMFSKPSWQTGAGVPGDNARDVPDVSLNASNAHDGYLLCSQVVSQHDCTAGYRDGSGNLFVVGGTSAGAPTFAGILALIQQKTGLTSLGPVNATLYQLAASSSSIFHSITTGNNDVPCSPGTPAAGAAALQCPSTGTFGVYNAAAGYNQSTGLGSPDADKLAAAWQAPANDYSIAATTIGIGGAGQSGSGTISIDPLGTFNGTVNLTCTPAQGAPLSCSILPASLAVNGSTATATLTVKSTSAHSAALPNS